MSLESIFGLGGKVALITGGTGHLGTSMAEALATAGARVVISSRSRESAEESARKLSPVETGPHVGVELDLLDEASIERGFDEAVAQSGGVDVLINNANYAVPEDLTTVSAGQFEMQLRNGTGTFLLSRLFRDHVVERNVEGSIVMIGSMYGMVGSYPDAYEGVTFASPVGYHMLKGGMIQMTRHLAVYWAKDRVRVNCLSPGPFPSDAAPGEMVERLCQKSPMGRMGRPGELQGALLLLASDAGSYMTGQNVVVDGGWTAW